MAEAERVVNNTEHIEGNVNNVASKASEPGAHQEEKMPDMQGWLMKRTKISHKWKRQYFHLKGTDMYYGVSTENHTKKIPLENAEISESNIDTKDNAFRIKPKDSKRVYYLHAENEGSQNDWMQAICFAKATGNSGDASQACVLQ